MPRPATAKEHRWRPLLVTIGVTVVLTGAALGGLDLSSTSASGTPGGTHTLTAASRRPLLDETPRQILAAATSAQARAHSMHLRGVITASGVPMTFALDVEAPDNGTGIFSERGTSITIMKKGSNLYLYAGDSFWAKNGEPKDAGSLGGRWLVAPATQASFRSLTQFFELFRLTTQLYPAGSGAIAKGAITVVDGDKTVPLTGRVTAKGVTQSTTLFVSATGTPYVLEASAVKEGERALIAFSHFGENVVIKVPPHPISYTTIIGSEAPGGAAGKIAAKT